MFPTDSHELAGPQDLILGYRAPVATLAASAFAVGPGPGMTLTMDGVNTYLEIHGKFVGKIELSNILLIE